jgi:hypothetical protein
LTERQDPYVHLVSLPYPTRDQAWQECQVMAHILTAKGYTPAWGVLVKRINRSHLWGVYLGSYPPGTPPPAAVVTHARAVL